MKVLSGNPHAVHSREYRKRRGEQRRAYEKSYRENMSSDRRKLANRRRNQSVPPEKKAEYQKRYDTKYKAKLPIQYLLKKLRYRCKKFGIEFDLDAADFILPSHCPVLGIPIVFPGRMGAPDLPSFDRVDPLLGYVRGNVHIISLRANTLKSNCRNPEELRAIAAYIERFIQ